MKRQYLIAVRQAVARSWSGNRVLGFCLVLLCVALHAGLTGKPAVATSSGTNTIIKDSADKVFRELHEGVSLAGLSFKSQSALNSVLRNADLSSSLWDDMVLDGSTFVGSNLKRATFMKGSLAGADFRRAVFQNTEFLGVNLSGANFSGSSGSVLLGDTSAGQQVLLNGANLSGLTIKAGGESSLTGADLRGANLSSVKFYNGSFAGADLTGANLKGAIFRNVDWTGVVCPNGLRRDWDCTRPKPKVVAPIQPQTPVSTSPRVTTTSSTTTTMKAPTSTIKAKAPPTTARPRVITKNTSPRTTEAAKVRKKPGQCTTWMYGLMEVYWDNGSTTVVDGNSTKKCVNGVWRSLDNSGGSSGSSASVIGQECSLEESGMYSSFYGQGYRWRIYDVYSDGRRNMARFGFGSGYENQVPSICW